MDLDKVIRIKSNIKAIAWTYIAIFAALALYFLYSIVIGVLMHFSPVDEGLKNMPEFNEMRTLLYDFIFVFILALGFSIIAIVVAYELTNFRRWAAVSLNVISLIVISLILFGVAYVIFQFHYSDTIEYSKNPFGSEMANYQQLIQKVHTIFIGTIGLFICWAITKINLLLMKKEYKSFLV